MITHPDPEVQHIIAVLEKQRDDATCNAAVQARDAKMAQDALAKANNEIGRLNEGLVAAAQAQGVATNVIDMPAIRVIDGVEDAA